MKEKNFLNKIFIISLLGLIGLQILFVLFGFVLTGAGHGTYVQLPIFYSWLFLPAVINWPREWISDSIQIAFLFFIPVAFFIFSMSIFVALWYGKITKNHISNIVTFHFLIAFIIIVIFSFRNGIFFPSFKIQLIATAISLSLSALFWRIFFQVLNHKEKTLQKNVSS